MNKDSFQSSTGKLIQPTQRPAPGGTAPLPRPAPGRIDDELRAKAQELAGRVEPRIELLTAACRSAKLPLPGVLEVPFKHPLPANAKQAIEYLIDVLGEDARLAQAVQVAVFRFQQLADALAAPGAVDLELLRRNVFFLSNLPTEFKGDRILAVLFPPPRAREGVLQAKTASPELQRQQQERREEAVKKAIALGQALAPRMVVARMALDTLEKGLVSNVSMMLTPQGRQAKMIAIALTGDAETATILRESYDRYEALKAAVGKLRSGAIDIEDLRPIVLPLGQLGTTFKDHALLSQLFPRAVA